jgi:hypothetical protein
MVLEKVDMIFSRDHFLSVYKAIILVGLCTSIACSMMDVEYNHDVAGTGTVMTDYRIGNKQSSEASGAIRGTAMLLMTFLFLLITQLISEWRISSFE